ncbi:UDP-N-acetylmuramate--L-alanine ligase [Basilea psittacipulmonis]|uniref:UDP-N-acetylmuramate--L-alanine ligase n=1 Tax=Basilea psittacipulmonis DSM 24701 TaxID=1072685 RepID=A0A077DDW1_9BURK|nr:UDP-N-acetylmuramate--L-alanine ligase [Basilea psittacipulmonis]AIL32321.1 UDP-N-acetylmuramate--alanine ligase [Basilea psittacipulmonis DSM 24701]
MKHKIGRIHFIGIGGAGMSGIAEVLLNLGYQITGSDVQETVVTKRLEQLGAKVFIGHHEQQVVGADTVVISSAIVSNNPEVLMARKMGLPVVQRATMLAELMRFKQGIAVSGTHGKTTTTSLIASILAAADLDPTFVIGGKLNSAGANARLGKGEFIVVEADESDASFLNLLPVMSVITNIDVDHMDTYGHNLAHLLDAFISFTRRLPFYGSVIACYEDKHVRDILPLISSPVITYGFDAHADFQAVNVRAEGTTMSFDVVRKEISSKPAKPPLRVKLNLPGKHNVLNAMAAIVVADELKIPDEAILKALETFNGVGRRFNVLGQKVYKHKSFTVVDDYGHHPTELSATIDAARGAWPGHRLIMGFQPHRYTRTRDCFDDFVRVLGRADVVALCDVYAAGESMIPGANSEALKHALEKEGVTVLYESDVQKLPHLIAEHVEDGDIVLMSGAGSISRIANQFSELMNG